MKMTRRDFLRLSSAAAAACGVTLLPAQKADAASEIQTLLEEAYLYAFPLVLVDATKTVSTNAKTPSANRAPVNQFIHARKLLDASSRTVVSPNVDTIYTQAWLDVSAEPQIYVVPETDRFFNVQVLDAWTNTAAVLDKAAGEMRDRVNSLVEYGADSVWVSTFHSLCVRILRRFIENIGYTTDFSIYDSDDTKTLKERHAQSGRIYAQREG